MFQKKKRRNILLSCMIAGLVFTACGDDEDFAAPPDAPKQAAPENPEAAADATAEDVEEVFTYNAIDRRDPFRSYFADLTNSDADVGVLSELQKIELDKFRLVGVVTGTATPMAMVQDSQGKGYTIKIGTRIGKQLGQVKQIRRQEIIIQEEFRDFTGKIIPVYKSLKLVEKG
jgi:type IV pilus assembly protein PilP